MPKLVHKCINLLKLIDKQGMLFAGIYIQQYALGLAHVVAVKQR